MATEAGTAPKVQPNSAPAATPSRLDHITNKKPLPVRDTGFGPILSFINTLVFIAILGIAIWIGVRIQSLHKAMFGGDGYDSPDRPTMHVYVMDSTQDVRVINVPGVTVVGTATVTVGP